LGADEIWGVRTACAKSLMAVSEAVSVSTRSGALLPLMEAFLDDPSKWVRQASQSTNQSTNQSLLPLMEGLP
jgi:hypothetical protein